MPYKLIDNTWENLLIIPLSHELATYTGRIHSKITASSGTTMNIKLMETGVLRKRKDGWKLLSGQTSVLPGM